MKLLIVEDDLTTREMLSTYLRQRGHEVICAADGLEAAGVLLPAGRPDPNLGFSAVITDCNMSPGKSGLWLLQYLNRSKAHLPVLLHSHEATYREQGHDFDLKEVEIAFDFARFRLKANDYSYIDAFLSVLG